MENRNLLSSAESKTLNPIQENLMAIAIALIDKAKDAIQFKEKSDELYREVQCYYNKVKELEEKNNLPTLQKLGFTNVSFPPSDQELYDRYKTMSRELLEKAIAYSNAFTEAEKRMNLISKMKEYWGEESLLVPFDDFEKVCIKYNLTCGTFEEYTGYIPADKIGKIAEIKNKLHDNWDWIGLKGCINNLYRIISVPSWDYEGHTSYTRECFHRFHSIFPFAFSIAESPRSFSFGERKHLFICAPKQYMKGAPKQYMKGAPKQYMKGAPKQYMKGAPKPSVIHTDPFICAHTDYGIMILEKWDLESEDEIIKNHEREQSSSKSVIKAFLKFTNKA